MNQHGPIILTAWRGGTYGLRVRIADRHRFLGREEVHIVLPVPPREPIGFVATVRPSFWKNCPEFRSAMVGEWLAERGLLPWPTGRPPRFEAEVAGFGSRVRIVRPVPRGRR